MAVLQHAPAGYLLSVPLTELQITIKESCLSFLLASRKTYSGSFTLIFIHLVIDKCRTVQRSLPPPGPSPGTFAAFPPPSPRTAPGGCSGSPASRKTRVGVGCPAIPPPGETCQVPGEVLFYFILFYFILFYFILFYFIYLVVSVSPTQPARLSRAGAVTGETGAARPASARCPARRIFSQLREGQTWK